MTTNTDCERVRIALMAVLDEEGGPGSAADEQHVSTCPSCQRWFEEWQSMNGDLAGLSYRDARVDLWPAVQGAIERSQQQTFSLPRQLWPLAAVALAWRGLQLLGDFPVPILAPLVPLSMIAVAVWLVGRDFLAIETSAPELQKGEL